MTTAATLEGTQDGREMGTQLCLFDTEALVGRLQRNIFFNLLIILKENYSRPETLPSQIIK